MRIRTIKPEFWQSEKLSTISREARLTFIGLWSLADDSGRTRAASRMLASALYPYDDDAPGLISGWLTELENVGAIRRYEDDGCHYIDIPKWSSHQKIDKPSPSKLPAFVESSRILAEPSRKIALDQGSGIRDQGMEQGKKAAAAAQPCKEIANQAAAAASIDDLLEKPDKTAIIARRHTLGDLKQAFPVLITFRNDEDEARTMFELWGWETLAQAIGILTPIARGRPAGKQRITVSELTQWLAAHGSLEAEDYKRAGLPIPENIK